MNFRQISTFQAVMTSQSLSDAAKKLGRTQPAVSAAIKSLEDQLGMELFERRGRKLIPVPEAQYLLAESESILAQMTRVRATLRSLSDGKEGRLKVAAMPGPVTMIFPKFIAAKIGTSDNVSVSIQARTSNQIAELTRAQSIDFGFADAPESHNSENLYNTKIITADCMVAIPEDHELAGQPEISIEDLGKHPIGTLPASHRQSRDLLARFRARHLQQRIMVESQTFLPVLHFVAAGQCSTVLDPLSVFLAGPDNGMISGVEVRPMRDPIRYHYAIFTPRYRPISVAARTLCDQWQDEVMRLLYSLDAHPTIEDG